MPGAALEERDLIGEGPAWFTSKCRLRAKRRTLRLWQGLRDLLRPAKLSFMIKNHTLTITTAEAAKEWQKKNIGEDEQP